MIFLSAQPDDYYFKWQLELQLLNFRKNGILPSNIHILIGYQPEKGLNDRLNDMIIENKNYAQFFLYRDKRLNKSYQSSIRPHIISQHLQKFPELQKSAIFYHDSDIIFRTLPNFKSLLADDYWYLSDTRNYLDSNYLIHKIGLKQFEKMCQLVGISPDLVVANDINCGGMQYLIKNSIIEFWNKVERDSTSLYQFLERHNNKGANKSFNLGKKRFEYKGLQSWHSDMWSLFWNALLFSYKVKIHKELNFCRPSQPISEWHKNKILHYSGKILEDGKRVFRKTNYVLHSPFFEKSDLKKISAKNCSFALVKLINEYRKGLLSSRIDLRDVSFLIPVRIDSESRATNLYSIVYFLDKYFDTNVIVGESDLTQKVDKVNLPKKCKYFFFEDANRLLHRTKLNNILIKNSSTKIIALYDSDVIFPIEQIRDAVKKIRESKADMVFPYDGTFLSVNYLFKTMFSKILDPKLLLYNVGKFTVISKRSYGGAVFVDREKYLNAGLENEFFLSWGPEDLERVKRMKNLGYYVKRVNGILFHLPHERTENSGYNSIETTIAYMQEYLKICNMNSTQLKQITSSWSWLIEN